jgi:hypothetical protein
VGVVVVFYVNVDEDFFDAVDFFEDGVLLLYKMCANLIFDLRWWVVKVTYVLTLAFSAIWCDMDTEIRGFTISCKSTKISGPILRARTL